MCASPDVFHVLHIRFTFFSIPTNSWVFLKNIRWSQRSLNEPKTQMHYCALDLQGGFCVLGVLCLGPSLCPTVQIQPEAAPQRGCTPVVCWGLLLQKLTDGRGGLLGNRILWKVYQTSLFSNKKQIIRRKVMFCISPNYLSLCSNFWKANESMFKWSNCKYHSLVTYFPLSLVKCDF